MFSELDRGGENGGPQVVCAFFSPVVRARVRGQLVNFILPFANAVARSLPRSLLHARDPRPGGARPRQQHGAGGEKRRWHRVRHRGDGPLCTSEGLCWLRKLVSSVACTRERTAVPDHNVCVHASMLCAARACGCCRMTPRRSPPRSSTSRSKRRTFPKISRSDKTGSSMLHIRARAHTHPANKQALRFEYLFAQPPDSTPRAPCADILVYTPPFPLTRRACLRLAFHACLRCCAAAPGEQVRTDVARHRGH